jgi:hypothetical protein
MVTSPVRWTRSRSAVIAAPQTASRARHGDDHRPFAHAAQVLAETAGRPAAGDGPLRDENSLPKVQNVGGDSCAECFRL